MKKYSKKLTLFPMTVRIGIAALFLAVFFSSRLTAADSSLATLEASFSQLIYDLSRSLVTVESYSRLPDRAGRASSPGAMQNLVASGLVVNDEGHILVSAESVIGSERVMVESDRGRFPARLLAVDYVNMLALLDVGQPVGTPVICSDQHACAGQMVVALGNAHGLRVAPSLGICAGAREDGTLQFSVPVTSGAVGGGVFDLSGRLLGMITGAADEQGGAALVFPGHRITGVVEYILTHGDRQAGYVGISSQEIQVNPPLQLVVPNTLVLSGDRGISTIDAGVLVTSVFPKSPAARAGLRKGDLIYAIGNKRVKSVTELSSIIRRCEPGMTVNIELIRLRNSLSVPLTVGRRETPRADARVGDLKYMTEHQRVVDSLSAALNDIRGEISRLERRLKSID